MLSIVVLTAALGAAGGPAAGARAQVESRVAELAPGVLPPLARARVAPPVPSTWPPPGPVELVFRVYAAVLDPSLGDAERILSAWALATLPAGAGDASLRTLRSPTRELGIQGVRPLAAREAEALSVATRDRAETALARLAAEGRDDGPEAAEVRRYYCAWISVNGVIAADLKGASGGFFDWLGCR